MTSEDVAAAIVWVATLPPHLNVNALELMSVSQSFAGFQSRKRDDQLVYRKARFE